MMRNFIACILLISCTPQEPAQEPEEVQASSVLVESPEVSYDRKEWRHWIDADKDCQDARQEVLVAESVVPVTFKEERECKVATGEWHCPFTGQTITDPSSLDVDHFVPLKEAHVSGAYGWDAEQKKLFANDLSDPGHLVAVTASSNRSKGSRGPDAWMPPNEAYHCEYLKIWVSIKKKWDLEMDRAEVDFILSALIDKCMK